MTVVSVLMTSSLPSDSVNIRFAAIHIVLIYSRISTGVAVSATGADNMAVSKSFTWEGVIGEVLLRIISKG